jgi:hypothetical protein
MRIFLCAVDELVCGRDCGYAGGGGDGSADGVGGLRSLGRGVGGWGYSIPGVLLLYCVFCRFIYQ